MARTDILPPGVELGLTLDRYQEIKHIPLAAFNGLYKADEQGCSDCAAIWRQIDRDGLALAIAKAEEMREQELGYHITPRYIVDEPYDVRNPLVLKKKHLISVGVKATSNISLGVALTLGPENTPNDPVTFTIPTTVTDVNEIKVFYPGEDVEIHPSKITLSGGNVTIEIPRARLIDPDIDTNCDPAPSYYENDNFLTTVDVKRVYTDIGSGAFYIWFPSGCDCASPSLSESSQLAYSYITNNRLSVIELYPASYSGGIWAYTSALCLCGMPIRLKVSYLSGRQRSAATEIDTSRLAHTFIHLFLPPTSMELCGNCWEFDREIDKSVDMTPYGNAQGAIAVWLADSRAKVGMGGKFPALVR